MTREEINSKVKELSSEAIALRKEAHRLQRVCYYIDQLSIDITDINMKLVEDSGLNIQRYFEYLLDGELSTTTVNKIINTYNEHGLIACASYLAELEDLFTRL